MLLNADHSSRRNCQSAFRACRTNPGFYSIIKHNIYCIIRKTLRTVGNQKHYQANAASPIFAELCGIAQKTIGLAEPLRQALKTLEIKITAAFVYGSVAKKSDTAQSDIDLMVLSDELTYGDVFLALQDVGRTLGREVNPTILTRAEYGRRIVAQESFLSRVLEQPKVWIIGNEDDIAI